MIDTNQLVLAGFMLGQLFVRDVTFPRAEREYEREQATEGGEPLAVTEEPEGGDAMLRYAESIVSGEYTPVEDCAGPLRHELQRDFVAAAKCIVAAVNEIPPD